MAQVATGIIGGAIGFVLGGPTGALYGAQLGFAVGSYVFAKDQVIQGPKIGELTKQFSQENVPRPIIFGTCRPIGGNIIWVGEAEIRTKKEKAGGGKGGGGSQTVESEEIYRSYAIRICEGPIGSVTRVWRNNKLVFDARTGYDEVLEDPVADLGDGFFGGTVKKVLTQMGLFITTFTDKATFFYGSYEQLPSSTIEAEEGVGNVPAHRGTCYMVVEKENLTDLGGAVPQYQFEVQRCGMYIYYVNQDLNITKRDAATGDLIWELGKQASQQSRAFFTTHANGKMLTGVGTSNMRWINQETGAKLSLPFAGVAHDIDGVTRNWMQEGFPNEGWHCRDREGNIYMVANHYKDDDGNQVNDFALFWGLRKLTPNADASLWRAMSHKPQLNPGIRDLAAPPLLTPDETLVICGDNDGFMYAVDADTGDLVLWATPFVDSSPPAVLIGIDGRGFAYFFYNSAGGMVVKFDPLGGTQDGIVWKRFLALALDSPVQPGTRLGMNVPGTRNRMGVLANGTVYMAIELDENDIQCQTLFMDTHAGVTIDKSIETTGTHTFTVQTAMNINAAGTHIAAVQYQEGEEFYDERLRMLNRQGDTLWSEPLGNNHLNPYFFHFSRY